MTSPQWRSLHGVEHETECQVCGEPATWCFIQNGHSIVGDSPKNLATIPPGAIPRVVERAADVEPAILVTARCDPHAPAPAGLAGACGHPEHAHQ
jgi:hypothetical protein